MTGVISFLLGFGLGALVGGLVLYMGIVRGW
jgi:hypothetical protein